MIKGWIWIGGQATSTNLSPQIQLQASHVGGQVDRQTEDDSSWHRAVAPRDNNPDTQQPIQANDLF